MVEGLKPSVSSSVSATMWLGRYGSLRKHLGCPIGYNGKHAQQLAMYTGMGSSAT